MPIVAFGNESVVERVKKDASKDDSPDNVQVVGRQDLGNRVTTMALNEPSLAANVAHVERFWGGESDEPPAWVESDSDALEAVLADHYGCPRGRPKSWKEG